MQTQVVTLDVLKPIGTTVDLSDSFNARVGDKMTPFQLFITEGGVAKDLKGMHPELEAIVGNGALKGNKAIMNAGAKGVHWVGSTNNVTGYNQLTLAFPAEVFPQSGFCYGHLILANEAGVRESSVDIWFQVLDGTPQMGMVADHYDSELALELAKAKNENEQFSQEMRDTYNQQVTEAQNALTKATANLNSLAATAGNVEAQITAQDIITRPEYNDLATKINRTLANFDLHPEDFASQADLLAKYPNGAEGLKVTVDTMHKWLYLNGAWVDKGPFTFNDLSPKEKAALYSNSDNLLVNPDLNNDAYGWNMTGLWEKDSAHAIENSMAYGCNHQTKPTNPSLLYQDGISVEKHSTISVVVKAMTDSALVASLQILFRDASGNIIDGTDQNVTIPANTYNEYQPVEIKNVTIPATAVTAAVTVANLDTGLVIICRPQVNFDSFGLPYSIRDILNRHETPNNILLNSDLGYSAYGWEFGAGWEVVPNDAIGNSMTYGINLQTKPLQPSIFEQSGISVAGKTVVSAGVTVSTDNAPKVGYFQVSFKNEDNKTIQGKEHSIAIPNGANKQLLKLENIAIPPEAKSLVFAIVIENTGVVNICRPQLNFEKRLLYYSLQELSEQSRGEDNALENPNLKFFAYGWNIDARWQEDPAHAIGNSMAYGCYLTEKPQTPALFYQEDISVEKREKISVGIEAITDSALTATLQVLFRDVNGEIINGTDQSVLLPQNTSKYQTVKIENVTVPQNAISAAVTIAMIDKGLVVFCRPRFNYGEQLVPFSLSELNLTDLTTSSELPFFKFTTALGNVGNDWLKTQFSFVNGSQKIKGYAQIAIQGDSSRLYDKKNYKIRAFSDAQCKQKLKLKLMPTWPATNKFNLKANFIDATQSRNLASAKLVAAATAITPIADKTVESYLAKTSNFGQMEGFPIEVWFDDVYNGLYTCNTKKDDKVFGLDADKAGNAAVSILDNVAQSDTQLLNIPNAKLDNIAYADELHDTPDPELVANWSKWLEFLNNSTDEGFKANLASYIDVKSAINLYLFGVMSREYDFPTKSVLYLTWNNGKYFYLIPYDLDSNWGQSADGKIEGNPTEDDKWGFATETSTKTDGRFISNAGWNKLFERLYKLFMPEIKEQYTYLRSNVWRTDQLLNAYRDFMDQIPQSVYEKDHKLWAQIPSLTTNNYEQLHQVIVQRSNQMDRWISSK